MSAAPPDDRDPRTDEEIRVTQSQAVAATTEDQTAPRAGGLQFQLPKLRDNAPRFATSCKCMVSARFLSAMCSTH